MKVCGKKIKQIREQNGKKVTELAVAADLGERRIQQIEEGEIVNLNLNVVKAIAKFLGTRLEFISAGGGKI